MTNDHGARAESWLGNARHKLDLGTHASAEAQVASMADDIAYHAHDLDDGLLRSWERPDFGIARHYGYAVQWFSFCGLIVFLYVFFHVKSSRSKKNQADAPPPGSD